MGFTWRGKGTNPPQVAEGAETSGADVLPDSREERNLAMFKKQHEWDPFLDIEKIDAVDEGLASGDPEKQAAIEDSLIADDSPYPEVRSSVCCEAFKHDRAEPAKLNQD
jgi:hypothetical protein